MSRPRKPFGPNPPGRLAATMLKVLAAEMSDPARLTRGKRYWSDDAVIDLMVGHGAVTAEVQGSRAAPYVVTIETRPGRDLPSRRDLSVWCTCPDDLSMSHGMCKHAVATMFALSDEVAVDPDVLARWRRSDQLPPAPEPGDHDDPRHHDHDHGDHDHGDHDHGDQSADDDHLGVPSSGGRRRHLVAVGSPEFDARPADPPPMPTDPLAEVLGMSGGPVLPPVPALSDLEHPRPAARPGDQLVAAVLDDALHHLRIRWD